MKELTLQNLDVWIMGAREQEQKQKQHTLNSGTQNRNTEDLAITYKIKTEMFFEWKDYKQGNRC